jgi:hypothetical protein
MSTTRLMLHRNLLGVLLILLSQGGSTKASEPAGQGPIGTWHGQSTCVVRPSGCHDEESLYRVSGTAEPDRVLLSGNKIVDHREVNMGSGECRYDAKSQSMDCPLPNGSAMRLEVHENVMEGAMTLHDGALWRKISLRREQEK